jgi:hypothetical protein
MAIKELQTRIALKYDSYANWSDETKAGLGANLVLLPGELGICYVGDANQGSNVVPTVLFKVGDGKKTFKELPWASAKAADVYSWAKASDVVYNQTAKTITFVKGNVDGSDKVITFNYMTEADVKGITDGLTTRIANLEAKFTGDSSVQSQINALDGRLDVIEGGEDVDGSVDNAIKIAKAYTDEREDEIEKAYKKYTDDADAARKTYVDGKVETLEAADTAIKGRLDVIESTDETKAGSIAKALKDAKDYADQAELDAVASAKSYTDGRETAITTAYQTYADQAEADAKSYSDEKLEAAVEAQATADANQNTEIGKKLDKTTYEAYIAGKEMSDAELKSYADGKASDAQTAAISAAKTETEKQVKALADGQVEANRAAIAAMDTAYKAADSALDGRLNVVEAALTNVTTVMDFVGAGATLPETAQKGDVFVINSGDDAGKEFVYDGTTWVEFGYATANENAIAELKDRMDAAEDDIDQAQADIEALETNKLAVDAFNNWKSGHESGHAKSATEITDEITAAVNVEKSRAEGAEKAINDKIGTLPSDYTTLVAGIKAAKDQADQGVADAADAAGRLDVVEPKVTTLQDLTNGYTGKGSIKTAVEAAQAQANKGVEDAGKAQAAADKAQGEVDALETVVAGVKSTADKATTDLAALTTRVGTAEGKITTIEGIVSTGNDSNANLRSAITELQTLTGTNGAIRSEIADAKKAGTDAAAAVDALAKGQVATNKSNIEDHETRIASIEGDYLKAADVYVFNCGSSTLVTHEQPKA